MSSERPRSLMVSGPVEGCVNTRDHQSSAHGWISALCHRRSKWSADEGWWNRASEPLRWEPGQRPRQSSVWSSVLNPTSRRAQRGCRRAPRHPQAARTNLLAPTDISRLAPAPTERGLDLAVHSPRRFDVRTRRRRGTHSWPALLALTLAGPWSPVAQAPLPTSCRR